MRVIQITESEWLRSHSDRMDRRMILLSQPTEHRMNTRNDELNSAVELTVAELDQSSFTVSLIPESIARTNLGTAQPGTKVNLEVDVLAKYVERLIRNHGGDA